ncbi:MAG: phosphonate metabolism protein PhnI [Actinobacteria bacterium]|jgi:alpha-D-ribose 1-methylphosphonate 5-triphosphate synthase subunit PhnI|nr:phosphonate metabolism protein PhnI [Actinomycetota bacterium]
MGYAAARGGLTAIRRAEELVRSLRDQDPSERIELNQFTGRLRLLVDRVMGEAGLWAPELAALALRQAEGDTIEAVHLLRAYKSTLPRLATALTTHANHITLFRRVVPAFREASGPQILGRSTDYSARMLDPHSGEVARPGGRAPVGDDATVPSRGADPVRRLVDTLRDMQLLTERRSDDDPEPFDITRSPARPPAPRSARLSSMARAETGSLVNQWYRNILGPDGYLHEVTLGEVRHGSLPVRVTHPLTGGAVTIGNFRVTEVEAIEDLNGIGEERDKFDVGYGLCLGHNERKAIAMANLDIACHRDAGRTSLEQSILLTTDGLDSAGFLEHLKLPHYVTFRSMVERKLAVRAAAEKSATGTATPGTQS